MIQGLTLLGFVGAAAAVVVYFVALAQRPSAVRLLNGSGLFFTGAALAQAAWLSRAAPPAAAALAAWLIVALLLAAFAQATAALRNRRAWDGAERRGAVDPDAPAPRERVFEIIREQRDQVRERYKIDLVGVTGSMARGDDKPYSDVDVVYDPVGRPSLFDIGGAMSDLQDAFNRKVDLIDLRFVEKSSVRTAMERDLIRP